MWFPSAPSTKGGPQPRVSSPDPARSTLITSAPRSASTCPAQGPARIRASSRTRKPVNGFVILRSYLPCGAFTRLSKFARLCGLGGEFCLELTLATNIGLSPSAHTENKQRYEGGFHEFEQAACSCGSLGCTSRDCACASGFSSAGQGSEDFPSIPRRHHRSGRLPRPAVPQVCGWP